MDVDGPAPVRRRAIVTRISARTVVVLFPGCAYAEIAPAVTLLAPHAGGLVVICAASLDEARAIAARDPFVERGAHDAQVLAWSISCEANAHLGAIE